MTLIYIQGSNSEVILMEADTPKFELRLRCRVRGMRARRKCDKCLQPNEPRFLSHLCPKMGPKPPISGISYL